MGSDRCRAALLALLLVAGGCGGGDGREPAGGNAPALPESAGDSGATPARGDAVVFGTIGDASTLIPMLASDSASHEYAENIFDGLLTYDKTLSTLEPRLAENGTSRTLARRSPFTCAMT